MSGTSLRLKISYLVGSLVLASWFATTTLQHDHPIQSAYEGWLKDTLPKIYNPKLDDRPTPEVTLSAIAPERNINWVLKLNTETNAKEVARLLEMLKESKLLSEKPARNPALTMKVESNSESFSAQIEAKSLEDNEKAQSLLKLFQIYAANQQQPGL